MTGSSGAGSKDEEMNSSVSSLDAVDLSSSSSEERLFAEESSRSSSESEVEERTE